MIYAPILCDYRNDASENSSTRRRLGMDGGLRLVRLLFHCRRLGLFVWCCLYRSAQLLWWIQVNKDKQWFVKFKMILIQIGIINLKIYTCNFRGSRLQGGEKILRLLFCCGVNLIWFYTSLCEKEKFSQDIWTGRLEDFTGPKEFSPVQIFHSFFMFILIITTNLYSAFEIVWFQVSSKTSVQNTEIKSVENMNKVVFHATIVKKCFPIHPKIRLCICTLHVYFLKKKKNSTKSVMQMVIITWNLSKK